MADTGTVVRMLWQLWSRCNELPPAECCVAWRLGCLEAEEQYGVRIHPPLYRLPPNTIPTPRELRIEVVDG